MSVPPPRVVCSRCGVNNFATQAACWKCGAPLGPAAVGRPAAATGAPSPATPGLVLSPSVGRADADPSVAPVAAAGLALLFPLVAVPAGLVFLMLDDRRKIELGKILLIWGVVATIAHMLVTAWLLRVAYAQASDLLGRLPGRSQPRPDMPVPPIEFPGQRP